MNYLTELKHKKYPTRRLIAPVTQSKKSHVFVISPAMQALLHDGRNRYRISTAINSAQLVPVFIHMTDSIMVSLSPFTRDCRNTLAYPPAFQIQVAKVA